MPGVIRPCNTTSQVSLLSLCPTSLENTFYQDLSGRQGDSGATGDPSAQWPTVEPVGPAWPSPQQPLPLQPGSYPAGDLGQPGVPVPLYAVPETHLPGIRGSMLVTEAPGGRTWEETQQTHLPSGKNCAGLAAGGEEFWREEPMGRGRDQWELAKTWLGVCTSPGAGVLHTSGGIALSLPLSSLWGQARRDQLQPLLPSPGAPQFLGERLQGREGKKVPHTP